MINIAERLRPFSHLPGTSCLIPGTDYVVQAFPACILIREFKGNVIREVPLEVNGPLKQFTVMQDLEKGCVTIFSEQYRCHILPNLEVVFHKNPSLPPLSNQERLSLGSHKKQEWEEMKRKRDFYAIFPLWFRLGGLMKLPARTGDERGLFKLLGACREAIHAHRPEEVMPAFERLFLAGFESLMVPRPQDNDKQGILPIHEPASDDSPLYLLTEGAALIRSLFIMNLGNEISILPNLPPECFAGRLTHMVCPKLGLLDLEWTKKMVRRLHFHAQVDGEVIFHFPPHLKHFRLRTAKNDRGRNFSCGDCLAIKSGSHYLLDRFQK